MQLSTSVGAAANKYAVPPKLEEDMDSGIPVPLNGVSDTVRHITALSDVAKQCMIVEGVLHGQPATILLDSGAQSSHISSTYVVVTYIIYVCC